MEKLAICVGEGNADSIPGDEPSGIITGILEETFVFFEVNSPGINSLAFAFKDDDLLRDCCSSAD